MNAFFKDYSKKDVNFYLKILSVTMKINILLIPVSELKDWATIVSIFFVVIGWFLNSWLSRKNEIKKRQLDLRLPTLIAFLELVEFLHEHNRKPDDAKFLQLTHKVHSHLQLYGQTDEIEHYEKFIEAIRNRDNDGAAKAINVLKPIILNRVRKSLNIK